MGGALASDTVFAPASAPGVAARAVIRVAGPRAIAVTGAVVKGGLERARGFRVAAIELALDGWPLVAASAWVFRAPRSYTGEDLVELHVPGATPLVMSILAALEKAGGRRAGPGEFTRRAFLAGRLDLAQAEAVLALTSAEGEGAVRAAARALRGGIRQAIDAPKEELTRAAARIEASLDVFDDDDEDQASASAIVAGIDRAREALVAIEGRLAVETTRGVPVVVLAGRANAGKSTLLNALAGRPVAIVSPVAGTTRDVVVAEVSLLSGRTVRVIDVAGTKEAVGPIEVEALARASEAIETADVVVQVIDATAFDESSLPNAIVCANKIDLVDETGRARVSGPGAVLVSATTGEGLEQLRGAIAARLDLGLSGGDLLASERQRAELGRARRAVGRALEVLGTGDPARLELAAVEVRESLDALGALTGEVTSDDVLDRLFGEFCVGK